MLKDKEDEGTGCILKVSNLAMFKLLTEDLIT